MEITSRCIQYGLTIWIILQLFNLSSAVDCGKGVTVIADTLYKWNNTPSGGTQSNPCRSPFNKGFINRTCDGGVWQDPVWSSCETVGEMVVVKTIHYIGGGLTIFFCLLTLLLLACFWKSASRYLTALIDSLCLAIIASNAVFMASVFRTDDQYYCQIAAICLQYFPTVVLFAIGVIILFIAQSSTCNSCFVISSLAFTWCGPIIIVAAYGSVTQLAEYGNSLNCWVELKTWLFWVYIIPFLVVIGIAVLTACCSSFNAYVNRKKQRVKRRVGPISLFFVTLFTILTWTIGTISVNQYEDPTYVLQIVFAALDVIQGILIFVIFGIRSSKLREPSYQRQRDPKTAAVKKKAPTRTSAEGMRRTPEDQLPPAHVFSSYQRFVMGRVNNWRADNSPWMRPEAESNVDPEMDFYSANNHLQRHQVQEGELLKRVWRSKLKLEDDADSETSLPKNQTFKPPPPPPNEEANVDEGNTNIQDSTSRHFSDKGSLKSAAVPFFNLESPGIHPIPTEGEPDAESVAKIESPWDEDIAIPDNQIQATVVETTVEPPAPPHPPEQSTSENDPIESTKSAVVTVHAPSNPESSPSPSPPPPCLPNPGPQPNEDSVVVVPRQKDETRESLVYNTFINRESIGDEGGANAGDDARPNRVSKVRFDTETSFYDDRSELSAEYDDFSLDSSRKESPVPPADDSLSSSRQQISTPPPSPPRTPVRTEGSESPGTQTLESGTAENASVPHLDSPSSPQSPGILRKFKYETLSSPETTPRRSRVSSPNSQKSWLDLPPPPPPPPIEAPDEPSKPTEDDSEMTNPEVSEFLPSPPPPPPPPPPSFIAKPAPNRVSFTTQPFVKKSTPKYRPQNPKEPTEFYLTADFLRGRIQNLKSVKDTSYGKISKEEPYPLGSRN